jgi:hypothetical protein
VRPVTRARPSTSADQVPKLEGMAGRSMDEQEWRKTVATYAVIVWVLWIFFDGWLVSLILHGHYGIGALLLYVLLMAPVAGLAYVANDRAEG